MADIAATVVTVIAYFFYDFHLNRVSGYYRVFMIMGLLSLFIANFRRIFNNVGDKLRASVLWVLIINNTIPLLSFVLSKNPDARALESHLVLKSLLQKSSVMSLEEKIMNK